MICLIRLMIERLSFLCMEDLFDQVVDKGCSL